MAMKYSQFRTSFFALVLLVVIFIFIFTKYKTEVPKRNNCSDDEPTLDCFNEAIHIDQDNPALVRVVRKTHLFQPAKFDDFQFRFTLVQFFQSDRVSKVASVIKSLTKSPGFFIECGALDGIIASNTIWLERDLHWSGLLIEANPKDFSKLRERKRFAWTANVCLSDRPYPKKVKFYLPSKNDTRPGIAGLMKREQYNTVPMEVQCVPLYTLLLAINQTTIDLFSLDIEGTELETLKTIPFDKVLIKILIIENAYIPGGHKALSDFLIPKGFIFYDFAPSDVNPWDSIFIHSSLPNAVNLGRKTTATKD